VDRREKGISIYLFIYLSTYILYAAHPVARPLVDAARLGLVGCRGNLGLTQVVAVVRRREG